MKPPTPGKANVHDSSDATVPILEGAQGDPRQPRWRKAATPRHDWIRRWNRRAPPHRSILRKPLWRPLSYEAIPHL